MTNDSSQHDKKPNAIERLAQKVYEDREMLGGALGVTFTYYPQSLKRLEERIDELYPEGERQVAPQMAVVIGVYLGETIRRNLHKRGVKIQWKEPEDDDILDATLEITGVQSELADGGSTFHIKPLLRAYKFINADRTEGMYAMYAMLQDVCHGRVEAKADEKWRQAPRGYTYRVVKVEKERE